MNFYVSFFLHCYQMCSQVGRNELCLKNKEPSLLKPSGENVAKMRVTYILPPL